MAGIAGVVSKEGTAALVEEMLERIAHRGNAGREMVSTESLTMGAVWTEYEQQACLRYGDRVVVRDWVDDGHFAQAISRNGEIHLERDPLGVAPLYYGRSADGALCFASEVKALVGVVPAIQELVPGSRMTTEGVETRSELQTLPAVDAPVEEIAGELRRRLDGAIEERVAGKDVGSWLSGGLDSSTMAALARPHLDTLHTFAAGLEGAPDLEHARRVAGYIDSEHHEIIVTFEQMLAVLPEVIYHLESFDALLVRSTITNYLVAKVSSDYVPAVLSGEGGDEFFAGYSYLKEIDSSQLSQELLDIAGRLHNTALQRVDRSASAHGTVAITGFLAPEVTEYALRIPVEYKLRDGVEKWILRVAMDGSLPQSVLERTKAKFWEGAGIEDIFAKYAEEQISDTDFAQERTLSNGWVLNTKEELLYWRIFREQYGELENLEWMGRTKGAPVS